MQLVASTFGYSQVSPNSEGRELSDKTRHVPSFNSSKFHHLCCRCPRLPFFVLSPFLPPPSNRSLRYPPPSPPPPSPPSVYDPGRYPTFNRVFAPSFKAAPALIDVLKHYNWAKVGVVLGHTPEDFSALLSFTEAAHSVGIEVMGTVKALSDSGEAMEELVEYMNRELPQIRIWVMFFGVSFRVRGAMFLLSVITMMMASAALSHEC